MNGACAGPASSSSGVIVYHSICQPRLATGPGVLQQWSFVLGNCTRPKVLPEFTRFCPARYGGGLEGLLQVWSPQWRLDRVSWMVRPLPPWGRHVLPMIDTKVPMPRSKGLSASKNSAGILSRIEVSDKPNRRWSSA